MPKPNYDHIPSGDLDLEDDNQRDEWYARFTAGTLSDYDPKPEPPPEPVVEAPEPSADELPHGTTQEEIEADLRAAIADMRERAEKEEQEANEEHEVEPQDPLEWVLVPDNATIDYETVKGKRTERNPMWRALLRGDRVFRPQKTAPQCSGDAQAFKRRARWYGNEAGARLVMRRANYNGTWGTVLQVVEPKDIPPDER